MPIGLLSCIIITVLLSLPFIIIYIHSRKKRFSKCCQNGISDHMSGQAKTYANPYPKATDKLGKSIQIILLISAVCSGIAAVIGLIGGFIDSTMWVWLGWGLSGVVVSLVAYWFVRTLSNIYLVLSEIRDNTKKL